MYFKLKLEDGTEVYKDLDDDDLEFILDDDAMHNIITTELGFDIEEWHFTERPSTYQDVVQVDISSAVIRENPPLTIDDKKITKVDLLEDSTYEHALASLSLSDPNSVVYSKNIRYIAINDEYEYEYEYDDGGYNDEPDFD
jgi:hypothetical protein